MAKPRLSFTQRVIRKLFGKAQLRRQQARVDAFLASYPKSGRTWFRFILSNYFNEAAKLGHDVSLHSTFSILPNFDLDPERGLPAARGLDGTAFPLMVAVHKPFSETDTSGRPVVLMVRDPRDVMVSAYFHATKHKQSFEGDFDAFIQSEKLGAPALIRYLNGWADGLSTQPHYVLTYEGLTADPVGSTTKVLEFLGCPVDPAAVRTAVELSAFDAMRAKELKEGLPQHNYDRKDGEALRMRKGKAGGYVEYLSSAQISKLEQTLADGLGPRALALVESTGCHPVATVRAMPNANESAFALAS